MGVPVAARADVHRIRGAVCERARIPLDIESSIDEKLHPVAETGRHIEHDMRPYPNNHGSREGSQPRAAAVDKLNLARAAKQPNFPSGRGAVIFGHEEPIGGKVYRLHPEGDSESGSHQSWAVAKYNHTGGSVALGSVADLPRDVADGGVGAVGHPEAVVGVAVEGVVRGQPIQECASW